MDKETLDTLNWLLYESSIWFKLWWIVCIGLCIRFGFWVNSVEKRISK